MSLWLCPRGKWADAEQCSNDSTSRRGRVLSSSGYGSSSRWAGDYDCLSWTVECHSSAKALIPWDVSHHVCWPQKAWLHESVESLDHREWVTALAVVLRGTTAVV